MSNQDPAIAEIEENAEKPTPVTPAKPAKTQQERAAEWQSSTDEVIENALLESPTSILGVELQPFTAARGSLLRKTKNEFIAGVQISEIEDPFMAIGKFLLLMSVDLREGRQLVKDLDATEDEAFALLDKLHMSSIEEVIAEINDYVEREMATQVKGKLPDKVANASKDTEPKN